MNKVGASISLPVIIFVVSFDSCLIYDHRSRYKMRGLCFQFLSMQCNRAKAPRLPAWFCPLCFLRFMRQWLCVGEV